MRRSLAFLLLLASASAWAAVKFDAVSVTATSQTVVFNTPRANILLCNYGSNEIYYRIFTSGETTSAATASTASNGLLVAGAATAPVCISFPTPATAAGYYAAVSLICDTAETATAQIISQ
jgi:hypothetical protein